MIMSPIMFAAYTAIVAAAGASLCALVLLLVDKDKPGKCCANCAHRMGCACKLEGNNHHEADCCESWEG